MISFDQVLLLEEKVESAVKKIEQLNAENAALRSKCAELSNALNAKSEQFSSFQSDQSKIEEGILKALSRLNAVENVVLQAASAAQMPSNSAPVPAQEPKIQNPVQSEAFVQEPQSVPNEELPSEIEIPAQPESEKVLVQEPLRQENPVQEQVSSEPSFEEKLTPDIGFEFGESDSSVKQPEQTDNSNQPMFDIF